MPSSTTTHSSKTKKGAALKLAQSSCSPQREAQYSKHGTCFTRQELSQALGGETKEVASSSGVSELLQRLRRQSRCDSDACLASRHTFMGRALRPVMPRAWRSDMHTWLGTDDIHQVLQQYGDAYAAQGFDYWGVHAIDFVDAFFQGGTESCVAPSACRKLRALQQASRSKSYCFGMVLNLDRHDKGGSHWVALFGDLRPRSPKYGMCYYDSAGAPPPREVARLMHFVRSQVPKKHFRLVHNSRRHQFRNTECGVFASAFIILCLQHSQEPYQDTLARLQHVADPRDAGMHRQRRLLWRQAQ